MTDKDYYRVMHYFFKRCTTGFKPTGDFMPGSDEMPKIILSDGYAVFVVPMDYMLLSDNVLKPFPEASPIPCMLSQQSADRLADVTEHYLRRDNTYYHALRCGDRYVHVDDKYLRLFPKCDFYFRDGENPIVLCTDRETREVIGAICPLAENTDGDA